MNHHPTDSFYERVLNVVEDLLRDVSSTEEPDLRRQLLDRGTRSILAVTQAPQGLENTLRAHEFQRLREDSLADANVESVPSPR